MRNYQDKKSARQILHSVPFLAFFGLMLLFFAWGVVGFMQKMEETRKNKNIAIDKVEELSKTKMKLSADIEALGTDKGKEASIRDKFGLAKEGEGLIVVVDQKVQAMPQPAPSGFFSFFTRWFK
jgi:cell division protein FtsB